jgi:RHS repeat-associated protein
MAKANPFRFSTKYQDDETDLVYYGYRYYSASTGRWINRDPIEEQHGQGSYVFVANSAISDYDVLGLLHSGQVIPVGEECTLRVSGYSPQPIFAYGKRDLNTKVGAYLRIEINCNCDACACYKWRQHYTKTEDGKRIADNVLDALKDEKWYPEKSSEPSNGCTYTFQDTPLQYPAPGMYMSSLDPVQRVVVSFELELVKLSNCSASSGTTVATIRWGFWYTKDANGLLNWDRHE